MKHGRHASLLCEFHRDFVSKVLKFKSHCFIINRSGFLTVYQHYDLVVSILP